MKEMKTKKKLHWVNIIFLTTTPLISVISITCLIWSDQLHWATWILTTVMALLTGISITAGYHRLFTHRSYEASWPIKLFFLIFGAASFENSAKYWCSDHREHHQHVDQELDPYNIKKGFFHAHIGWIFFKRDPTKTFDNISDLMSDSLIRFQDRYYYLIATLFGFLVPMAIASLWGDPWGGLFVAGMARVVFNHHATFLINSLCHFVGSQPFSNQNSSRDSWIMAFFTYGEGYHNFHHAFQADYRNGFRAYHWDPAKWIINILRWMKLARNLRRVPREKILLTKLRLQEKLLLEKVTSGKSSALQITEDLVKATRLKFEEAYARFVHLKLEYRKLKKARLEVMEEQLLTLKAGIQKTKRSFKEAKESWAYLFRLCLTHDKF